jgi:hypothetical protein
VAVGRSGAGALPSRVTLCDGVGQRASRRAIGALWMTLCGAGSSSVIWSA